MSTSNIKGHLADHLAIQNLMNRYTDAINQRDWKALEDVFAGNGIWDVGGPDCELSSMCFLFEGMRNVVEGIAKTVSTTELCIQSNHAAVIEVQGERATARSTIQEIARPVGSDSGLTLWGTYYDDIIRDTDGEWRFLRRSFRYTYVDAPLALPGKVITRFPPAGADPASAT